MLSCVLNGQYDPPAGYYNNASGLTGTALRNAVYEIINDHTWYPYTSGSTDTWDILDNADQDPDNSSNILDVYKNESYTKEGGGNSNYNREHTWPKSYGFQKLENYNYPYTDCHALFLANSGYNSSRTNKPYVDCDEDCTENATAVNNSWGGSSGTYPGNSNWTEGGATTGDGSNPGSGDKWETWIKRQGDVARALFYLDVRYAGDDHGSTGEPEPDLILTDNLSEMVCRTEGTYGSNANVANTDDRRAYMGLLSTLKQWHADDPVDEVEQRRNHTVYGYQGNRNPFVDNPTWVDSIFGSPSTTVQFITSATSVDEDVGTYSLTIAISSPHASTATTVNVALTGGTGTASDINSYSTQTVTFSGGSSADQTVTITVTDDLINEVNETLIFSLQSASGGNSAAVGSNDQFTLTINANDLLSAGDIAIVAFAFDNPDELSFIALEDLPSGTVIYFTDNGWTSDNTWRANEGTHTWTAGSNYTAGDIINFEVSGPAFANSGDQIIAYQGSSGNPTFLFAMNSEQTGWQDDATNSNTSAIPQGLTNETNAIAFSETDNGYYSGAIGAIGATMLSNVCDKDNWTTSDSRLDPGDYDPFPIRFSVSISGNSGFRMMSSPVAGTIYSDLLNELWIQGMTNGDITGGTANVWTLSGQSWSALSNLSTASLTAGQGFLVYVYADTDADGDDDLPVTLSVSGTENSSSATVPSSGSIADGDFALAGNPYASTIDFDNITLSNVAVTTSVWNDAGGTDPDNSSDAGWKTWNKTSQSGDLTGGLIAPYQGFWIEGAGGSGTITIETADKSSSSGTFYRTLDADNRGRMVFKASSDGHSSSNYLSFYEGGTLGVDDGESELLLPFQASSRVVMMSVVDGGAHKISSYPYDHEGSVSVPFDVMLLTLDETSYVTVAEEATLTWDLEELPDHISMTLTDNITGSETYLDYESEYVFTTEPKGSFSATYDGPIGTYPVVGDPRFTLSVTYGALGQNDDATLPSNFALHPVYPNPFNPSATISFDIPDVSLVALNVYDVKGALVETLLQDHMKPGKHQYNWEPQGLPSGVYFMKLTTAKQSFTQKVTYIK